jgi:hypothetical protein
MNPLLILIAILLFGVGASTGYLVKSAQVAKAAASPDSSGRPQSSSSLPDGKEQGGKSITLTPTTQEEGGSPTSAETFLKRISKISSGEDDLRESIARGEAVLALDPSQITEALSGVEKMKGGLERQNLRMQLLSRWAKSDPRAALAYAQSHGDDMEKQVAVMNLVVAWGVKDLPAAKAWVLSLPPGRERNETLQGLIGGIAQKDPAAAVEMAGTMTDDPSQIGQYIALNAWASKDADAAISYVSKLPEGSGKKQAFQTLLTTLSLQDPAKAITLLDQIPPGEQLNQALNQISSSWAQSDPKAALDWANQQSDPVVKAQVLGGVIQSIARNDPKGALDLALSLPSGATRDDSIQSVLFQMARTDPQGAINYATNLPSSDFKNNLFSDLALQWARYDPQGALAWYRSLTDQTLRDHVAGNIISGLYTSDQQTALIMLNSFPEGSVQRGNVATAIAFSMMHRDPQGAVSFVQSLPEGKSKDLAAGNLSVQIFQIDPQSIINFASRIVDSDIRSNAQQSIVRRWMRNDPAAATQWVNSSSLPQDVKTRLLHQ